MLMLSSGESDIYQDICFNNINILHLSSMFIDYSLLKLVFIFP